MVTDVVVFAYPWLPMPLILLSYVSSVWAKTRDILTLSLKSPLSAIQFEELQAERIAFRQAVAKVTTTIHHVDQTGLEKSKS